MLFLCQQLELFALLTSDSLRCNMEPLSVGIAVLALFRFRARGCFFQLFGLWLRARLANAPVSLAKWSDAAAQSASRLMWINASPR